MKTPPVAVNLQTLPARYNLERTLGQGGMGIVHQVIDRLTGQRVAYKQLLTNAVSRNPASSPGSLSDRLVLAHEFQILASLRHPNIISVIDYGFDAGSEPFFTMELLSVHETLLQAAHGKPLEAQVELLVQMLRALVYLHQHGLLHRDLKPSNVLVENDTVKLVDFGLSSRKESPGTASGTLYYIAPEVLQKRTPTFASDLYAVGVIAYEMFAGKRPFDASTEVALIYKVIRQAPDLNLLPVGAALVKVIERLLAKNPDERYSSAAEVIDALNESTGHAIPAETRATRESLLQASPFTGRKTELATLSAALEAARTGHGGAFMVGGESGVGKSRLFHELKPLAQAQGMMVVTGQAISESATPFQFWQDSLRLLAIQSQLDDYESNILKTVIPDIATLIGRDIGNAPAAEPTEAQKRLYRTISTMLRRQTQPILILLEDLHWATAPDLDLLEYLVRAAPDLPLLILGSYRDDERPDLAAQFPLSQFIKLDRLAEEEISALANTMLGASKDDPEVLRFLIDETEGNVFFLVEIVRALAEEAGQLAKVGSSALPTTVFTGGIQQIVQRRLDKVPSVDRWLLQVAAETGRQLDLPVITAAAPDRDLQSWLVSCANAAVIEVNDAQWRFVHDKLREGILRNIDAPHHRELSRTVATAIETAYSDNDTEATRLAYHWGQAENYEAEARYLFAIEKSADYYLQAVNAFSKLPETVENQRMLVDTLTRRAYVTITFQDATARLTELRRAETLVRRLPGPDGEIGGDQLRLARVVLPIGDTYFNQNKLSEALPYYEQGLAIGRALNHAEILARTLGVVGRMKAVQGRYAEAEPILAEAIEPLRAIGDRYAELSTTTTYTQVRMGRGYCDEGLAQIPKLLKWANDLNHHVGKSFTTTALVAPYMMMQEDYETPASMIYGLIEAISDISNAVTQYLPHGYAMWIEARRGNFEQAMKMREKAHEIERRANKSLPLWDLMAYIESELALRMGYFDEAYVLAEKALQRAFQAESVINEARARTMLGQALYQREPQRWAAVEAQFEAALRLYETSDIRLEGANLHVTWGKLLIAQGNFTLARTHLDAAAAQFTRSNLLLRLKKVENLSGI